MPKSLNAQEIISFINTTKNAVIATIKKDGSSHTAQSPLTYVDGTLYTYADPHSANYKNLKRDGRAAVVIPDNSKTVFIEGIVIEIGQANQFIDTLLKKFFLK